MRNYSNSIDLIIEYQDSLEIDRKRLKALYFWYLKSKKLSKSIQFHKENIFNII